MGQGGVVESELMPRLLVGYTEPGGGKLKKVNGFLKPNFGVGLNPVPFICGLYHPLVRQARIRSA